MKYGAKRLQWAPANADGYGAAVNLGALQSVTDSPTFNEAKGFGDNVLKCHARKFREAALTVGVTELSNENASALTGATLQEGVGLKFGRKDKAPYGGMGFHISKLLDDDSEAYQGVFYPRVKAGMQGEEYNTEGDTITLSGSRLLFTATANADGDWKILSEDFETEEEAEAWVDGQFAQA